MWAVLGLDRFFGSSSSASGSSSSKSSAGATGRAGQGEIGAETTAIQSQSDSRNGTLKRRASGGSGGPVSASSSEPSPTSEQAKPQAKANRPPWRQSLPALLLQVSLFQTTAGPIGFMALRHISYPTMVLGKVRHPQRNHSSYPLPLYSHTASSTARTGSNS